MRLFICALAVSAAAVGGVISGSAEFNPVRTHPQSAAAAAQVIVKLRDASASGTSNATRTAQSTVVVTPQQRIANLAARNALTMPESHPITERMHVMRIEGAADPDIMATTLARLRADPDVEYAEPDQYRYAHKVPNDPLFPYVSSINSGQWYLQNDPTTVAAINAVGAWDITTGDPNLVIADLDTGVLYTHPDLLASGSSGRLLPGYCFISDSFINNNGTCKGTTVSNAEATDPGDWITSSDVSSSPNGECKNATPAPSSWHGTRTAGMLGALTNNASGIAGMSWQGNILPVRVLGKCGGIDSDIIPAMLWAAGIAVTGAPTNPTPAKIINMSLGGTGACPQSYIDAINQVTAQGVLVVVSAGNEGGPVDTPANCAGAAGIAGIRHVGTKVGFSSLGPEIALAAPGGNCVNNAPFTQAAPCDYPIETTFNTGTTTAQTNSYTDQVNNPNLGTSFAAPIVSGIAALMHSVNTNLNSCQLIARLKEGSTPFPQTSAGATTQPPVCHVPASSSDLQTAECICTNDGKTCGAGMANALGAVNAALRPVAVLTLPASVAAGQSISITAQGSVAANGHTISSFAWTSVGDQTATIANGTTATASVTAPSCGLETVRVTVTDDAGKSDTADVVLSPTSASSAAPSSATATACSAAAAPQLAVCPMTASIQTGTTQSLTVSAANLSSDAVTWEVNGIPGGNSTLGTVSTTGVYTAPASVPNPAQVTVQAVSTATQGLQSATTITVTAPPPKSGGGGALEPLTLLVEALALGLGIAARRYARRCAASSQIFCARR